MAAKLPQSIIGGAPRGARPSAAAVDFGGVARAVESIGQSVAVAVGEHNKIAEEADDREAERLMTDFQLTYEPALQARAAEWDGQEPGFARRELQALDSGLGEVMGQTDKPGVRLALRRRADAARAGTAARVTGLEATRRAEPIRQAQLAERATQMTGADIAFNDARTANIQPLYDSYDGTGDLVAPVLAQHDADVAEVAPTVPEAVRAEWLAGMAGRRAKEAALAMEQEAKIKAAAVGRLAGQQGVALVNQILSNPSLYDENLRRLKDVAAAVPAELRPRFLAEGEADAVVARVRGLVKAGEGARAMAELNDGRYDAVITPEAKAGLLAGVDRPTVSDALKRAGVADAAETDVAATLAIGRAPGATSVAEVEAILGVDAAAGYIRAMRAATQLFGEAGSVRSMTLAQIEALKTRLTPDPTSTKFEEQKRLFKGFNQAAEAELTMRAADPAAWAMAPGVEGDGSDVLRMRYDQWSVAEGPDRAEAARAYAKATVARQELIGLPPAMQRVLPKTVAVQLTAGLKAADPNERAASVGRLASIQREFGPYAGLVARDLRAAGASPRDIEAASMTAGDEGRMSNYIAATNNPAALKALPDDGEKRLTPAINAALEPFRESLLPQPGANQRILDMIDAVTVTARDLVLREGLSPEKAAKRAVEMTGDYVYGGPRGGQWRMPKAVSDGGAADRVEDAARALLRTVTADDGAGLVIATNAPNDLARRRSVADLVRTRGRWVTIRDDSGLVLMVPGANGTWVVVNGADGKALRRTWDQLIKAYTPRRGGIKG